MVGQAVPSPSQKPPSRSRTAHIVMVVPDSVEHVLSEPNATYSFENLLSESPTLIVGEKRLKGQYKDVVGTDLMFDSIKERMAGFIGSNRRRLVFEEDDS